jgi:hypothetical protein
VLVVGGPLALAVLEIFHPHPPHDLLRLDDRLWLWIHYLQIPLFPLAALAMTILVRGVPGVAAAVCRIAMFLFAVAFTAFDVAAGVVTGVLVRAAHASTTPETWRAAIEAVWEHPVIGASHDKAPFLAVFGSVAWLVGALAGAIAIRRRGASWGPVLLVAFSALPLTIFKTHAWPGGPLTFGALAIGAAWLLVERSGARGAD